MNSTVTEELLDSIDISIKNITNFSNISDLEKAYLAKYLVVFISGVYEETIETIMNEKVEELKSKRISKYVASTIRYNFQNPKIGKVVSLLNTFDDEWGRRIDQMPDVNKTALGNIVTHKNDIAHGNSFEVTLRAVIKWYEDSRKIIEKIDEMVFKE
ncbi:MAG: hypothetical protein C5S48_05475 [Candidatus Methanogaster sp.]|nr:MAG: hypothetical protein C5S48_05475 [ANME-2 cluster archaeon]